jgi:uncharacterized damage-inducible protein DinB
MSPGPSSFLAKGQSEGLREPESRELGSPHGKTWLDRNWPDPARSVRVLHDRVGPSGLRDRELLGREARRSRSPAQKDRKVTVRASLAQPVWRETIYERSPNPASNAEDSAQNDEEAEVHMTVKDMESLFDYGYWANRKLFEVISQLTAEQFTQTAADNHGSIRNTMVHMLSAEWGWLDRCGGPARGAPLNPADFPTASTVVDTWERVEASMREFLSELRDEDLARNVEFAIGGTEKRIMPVGELLQHAANHGAHHRGQLSLLLRLLGYDPANYDLLFYFAEKRRSQA